MHHEFQTDNPFNSFIGVWKRVTTEPRSFFQEMPVSGGLQNPLLFTTVSLAFGSLGFLIFGPRGLALWFLIGGIVRGFVAAAILMVVARQMFGGAGDYQATYRVLAYASAPVALLWIPLVSPLIAIYGLFLVVVGLERVHSFDAVKSVLTVLLGVVVLAAIGWCLGRACCWTPMAMMRGGW
jgi:hypothetical protein